MRQHNKRVSLRARDWTVRTVPLWLAQHCVERWHYSGQSANTATYRHGLYPKDSLWDLPCFGVALWIPPTKSAAEATYPDNPEGVLCLSRLVCAPSAPFNAASFLISYSARLIDRKRWPCLLSYADEEQGHTGAIYRAANWTYLGTTPQYPVWIDNQGRRVQRKHGRYTLTYEEMRELGYTQKGSYAKHKYVHIA